MNSIEELAGLTVKSSSGTAEEEVAETSSDKAASEEEEDDEESDETEEEEVPEKPAFAGIQLSSSAQEGHQASPLYRAKDSKRHTQAAKETPVEKDVKPVEAEEKEVAPEQPKVTEPAPASPASASNEPPLFGAAVKGSAEQATFGPGLCITTWKNASTGTCMLKTDCKMASGYETYDIGFMCEQNSATEEHRYGQGSFNVKETFNTAVKCDKCLPLEDHAMNTLPSVEKVSTQIDAMKDNLAAVTKSVEDLKTKVMSALQLRGAPKKLRAA